MIETLIGIIGIIMMTVLWFVFYTSDWGWRMGAFECGALAFFITAVVVGILAYLLKGLVIILVPIIIFILVKKFLGKKETDENSEKSENVEEQE